MHKQYFETYSPKDLVHAMAVVQFESWSSGSGSMLPLTRARIRSFPLSIMGFAPNRQPPLTHAAITAVNEGIATIGGYVTHPEFRGRGLGLASLKNLVEMAPAYLGEIQGYRAYVNQAGLSQFAALGELAVGQRRPPAATGCDYMIEFAAPDGADLQAKLQFNLLH